MATYTDNYQLTLPTYAETADIATINNNMTKIDEIMHDSQISIATAYDASTTSENPYNTGDIVMYEKIAYRCKYDGVYGAWDASKWEQTTLADNLGGGDASEISYDNTTSGLTADDVQEAIDELEGNIEDVSDGLDDAVESLAPAYDSTQTYDEGDIVSYQNKLYECNTDQTTGAWDAQYWDEYIVSENMGASVSIIPETIEEPKRKVADYTIDGVSGSIYQSTMAEQIDSETGETDTAPYLFRASPQLDIPYERMNMKVVGGTVAWNQLAQNGDFENVSKWTTSGVSYTVTNNIAQITKTGSGGTSFYQRITKQLGHKYLLQFESYGSKSFTLSVNWGDLIQSYDVTTSNTVFNKIFNCVTGPNENFNFFANSAQLDTDDSFYLKNVNLIDLTQMFGSTIANYVYTLEQATAGSGIAWLQSYGFLTKDYYAYNVGSLESVKTSALKTVGFNAFDVTTGKAKLIGGSQYQITGTYTALSYSSGETITPDSSGKFTPSASGELTVTGGDSTTCVHFVYDGERDGEYEAYSEHTYALDSDLELRGIPKLDSNNNLYYDGDVYESDGTVTRKYGIVDLGDMEWTRSTDGAIAYFKTTITDSALTTTNRDFICSKYQNVPFADIYNTGLDKACASFIGGVFVVTDTTYTDATAFKSDMSGVYLVYELATPTTETSDAFQEPQIVLNWGTEEFVDTRTLPVPVGHDSLYLTDMRKKLEELPIIPPPSSNGTYVLVCTVASGKLTYSWETYTTTRSVKSEPQEEVKEEPKEEEETKEEQR